ncbi:MAG: Rid family hydrolase [Alphaproteobacteria bacterium]|nr:Rid family hydrolase [Alphaproteobacteria bacterium]
MHKRLAPDSLRINPNYSQGIETAPNMRIVAVAGQTGTAKDGTFAEDIGGQADQAWANVMEVLAEAGMGPQDIIHYTSYLVAGTEQGPYDEARLRHLGEARPASTKVFISGLARPGLLCEVQAFAAAPVVPDEPIV